MQNRIAETIAGLICHAESAEAGLTRHGDAIGITKVTPAGFRTEINGYIAGDIKSAREKTKLSSLRATANALVAEGREFVRLSREVLKPHLGKKPSAAWGLVGMEHSLAVPVDEAELLRMLLSFAGYFTDHPEKENAPLDVIGARATTLFNNITAARCAVSAQKTVLALALAERDAHGAALRKMLRTLIKELSIHLDPLSNYYPSFGLNRPGQKSTPDAPKDVVVTIVNENDRMVKWSRSPRADHYRVWKRVVGVDAEMIPIATRRSLDFTLEDLPRNADIELAISAVNNGGESVLSEVITIRWCGHKVS